MDSIWDTLDQDDNNDALASLLGDNDHATEADSSFNLDDLSNQNEDAKMKEMNFGDDFDDMFGESVFEAGDDPISSLFGTTDNTDLEPKQDSTSKVSNSTMAKEKYTADGNAIMELEEDSDFEPEYPKVEIVNRISVVDLCCKLDLRKIAISLRNCEYNPARTSSATIRWPVNNLVFRVHPNGRLMILGARSMEIGKKYAKKCAYLIKKLDHPKVRFKGFRSATIIGQFDCEFPIRLEALYADHQDFATYEPELMPGLVYRFPSTSNSELKQKKNIANDVPTIMIFVTGRCVITGCPTYDTLETTVQKIYPVLRQYRT